MYQTVTEHNSTPEKDSPGPELWGGRELWGSVTQSAAGGQERLCRREVFEVRAEPRGGVQQLRGGCEGPPVGSVTR